MHALLGYGGKDMSKIDIDIRGGINYYIRC